MNCGKKIEASECLPCSLSGSEAVVSNQLCGKVWQIVKGGGDVACHNQSRCLLHLKAAYLEVIRQQIQVSKIQDKETKYFEKKCSEYDSVASSWESKYKAEHALAESYAVDLQTAQSDLDAAKKKVAAVEKVVRTMNIELEALKGQVAASMLKDDRTTKGDNKEGDGGASGCSDKKKRRVDNGDEDEDPGRLRPLDYELEKFRANLSRLFEGFDAKIKDIVLR